MVAVEEVVVVWAARVVCARSVRRVRRVCGVRGVRWYCCCCCCLIGLCRIIPNSPFLGRSTLPGAGEFSFNCTMASCDWLHIFVLSFSSLLLIWCDWFRNELRLVILLLFSLLFSLLFFSILFSSLSLSSTLSPQVLVSLKQQTASLGTSNDLKSQQDADITMVNDSFWEFVGMSGWCKTGRLSRSLWDVTNQLDKNW